MNMSSVKVIAVNLALVVALCVAPVAIGPARAGIPVIDVTDILQNTVTAINQVAAVAKQIQQYQTQLQQYQTQIQNTNGPRTFTWDQAQNTMNNLRNSVDSLSRFTAMYGSVGGYTGQFQDLNSQRSSTCYGPQSCGGGWGTVSQQQGLAAQSQKASTDTMMQGLAQQLNNMQSDAAQLQRLQSTAQGAGGRMEAIQYANQFASHTGNQLLQIRALLVAQQNVIGTRNQAQAAQEARQAATGERLRGGTYSTSPNVNW
jgi:type IV secretion system protein TrbJ